MPKEEHFFDVYSGDFFKKNSNNEQPLITETNNQISCDRTNYQIEKNKL